MATVVDLGNLGSLGSSVIGDEPHSEIGLSVAAAGDINGDGIDDVIIGSENDAYVVFGQEGGIGNVDLDNLQPSEGFGIIFDLLGLVPGPSVSGAGDINGDGFDDIIVGGYQYGVVDNYGSIPNAYVIFGKAAEFDTIVVSDFFASATSDGFRISGEFASGYSGARVASAGDFNGDGFGDMLVGIPSHNEKTGAAYVIFGKEDAFDNIDLTNLDIESGFAIFGDTFGDQLGHSVSGAGDVNGDGYDDIILGSPYGDTGGAQSGQAYVIFGKSTGFGTIDLSNLDAGTGFLIQGDTSSDLAGWSVSAAGDVNGDGFDDVIVGAPDAKGGAGKGTSGNAGEAYVIFGKAGDFGTVELSKLLPRDGFIIEGDNAGDLVGWSVSGAGDLNSDGFADIIVGAPSGDSAAIDAGEAYVVFGKANGFHTVNVGRLADGHGRDDGFRLQGDIANDRAGWSVAGAGDVDGDGVDDLIVGAPWNDFGALGEDFPGAPTEPEDLNSGQVYVVYGAQLSPNGHGFGDGLLPIVGDLFW